MTGNCTVHRRRCLDFLSLLSSRQKTPPAQAQSATTCCSTLPPCRRTRSARSTSSALRHIYPQTRQQPSLGVRGFKHDLPTSCPFVPNRAAGVGSVAANTSIPCSNSRRRNTTPFPVINILSAASCTNVGYGGVRRPLGRSVWGGGARGARTGSPPSTPWSSASPVSGRRELKCPPESFGGRPRGSGSARSRSKVRSGRPGQSALRKCSVSPWQHMIKEIKSDAHDDT